MGDIYNYGYNNKLGYKKVDIGKYANTIDNKESVHRHMNNMIYSNIPKGCTSGNCSRQTMIKLGWRNNL